MKSNSKISGGRTLTVIGYKYKSMKVLEFIATEVAGSTEPGDPCLSRFPDIFSNISVRPIICTHSIGGYLNSCNAIYNQNNMTQSDPAP